MLTGGRGRPVTEYRSNNAEVSGFPSPRAHTHTTTLSVLLLHRREGLFVFSHAFGASSLYLSLYSRPPTNSCLASLVAESPSLAPFSLSTAAQERSPPSTFCVCYCWCALLLPILLSTFMKWPIKHERGNERTHSE